MIRRWIVLGWACVVARGCVPPDAGSEQAPARDVLDAGVIDEVIDGGPSGDADRALERCHVEGLGSPRSIAQVVALINALEPPVTIACVLESLDRPLSVYATSGTISAQPAAGRRSPRTFLLLDPLVLSIVPDGDGSWLLEMSEVDATMRSVKGEIPFPVMGPIAEALPYAHIMYDEGLTGCGFCHAGEVPVGQAGEATIYASAALRPAPDEQVMLRDVEAERGACDWEGERRRCEILEALFGWGEVAEGAFPEEMPTFY